MIHKSQPFIWFNVLTILIFFLKYNFIPNLINKKIIIKKVLSINRFLNSNMNYLEFNVYINILMPKAFLLAMIIRFNTPIIMN